MAGSPRVGEVSWLCRPGDDTPQAVVRLEERPDGTGWDLYVHDPADAPARGVHCDGEAEARAVLALVCEIRRADGYRWVRQPG